MMGLRMLALVDKRLRQATGKLDSPLGGFTVILFGDFGQLPPVGDRPLYADPTTSELSLHGHHIYHVFNTVVVLEQVLHQRGTDLETLAFSELLMRLRDGTTTQEDWQNILPHKPVTVMSLLMLYECTTTKQVLPSTILTSCNPLVHQLQGSLPFTAIKPLLLPNPMMLAVYTLWYSLQLVHESC